MLTGVLQQATSLYYGPAVALSRASGTRPLSVRVWIEGKLVWICRTNFSRLTEGRMRGGRTPLLASPFPPAFWFLIPLLHTYQLPPLHSFSFQSPHYPPLPPSPPPLSTSVVSHLTSHTSTCSLSVLFIPHLHFYLIILPTSSASLLPFSSYFTFVFPRLCHYPSHLISQLFPPVLMTQPVLFILTPSLYSCPVEPLRRRTSTKEWKNIVYHLFFVETTLIITLPGHKYLSRR